MNTMDKLRGTGRTTRMINEAFALARKGRAVYILAANNRERMRIEDIIRRDEQFVSGIKVETPESLRNFDWRTFSSPGMHPNCVVLADHYAIENVFQRMLSMLHRYDSED